VFQLYVRQLILVQRQTATGGSVLNPGRNVGNILSTTPKRKVLRSTHTPIKHNPRGLFLAYIGQWASNSPFTAIYCQLQECEEDTLSHSHLFLV